MRGDLKKGKLEICETTKEHRSVIGKNSNNELGSEKKTRIDSPKIIH